MPRNKGTNNLARIAVAPIFTPLNHDAMNIIKNFREQLGLSQQDLATYLSIAKSQISMVESGLRDLPTPALVKLAFFEQASLVQKEDVQQNNSTELARQVESCMKKIMLLEKKLTVMKNNYSQGQRLLQAVTKSKEIISNKKDDKKDKQWLIAQEQVANKKIKDNNLHSQKMLQIQIKVLQYEVKLSMNN